MRFHRFVLLKPLILLAVLPLERSLCQQTCADMPGEPARLRLRWRQCLQGMQAGRSQNWLHAQARH